jgi:hypothetical protein
VSGAFPAVPIEQIVPIRAVNQLASPVAGFIVERAVLHAGAIEIDGIRQTGAAVSEHRNYHIAHRYVGNLALS